MKTCGKVERRCDATLEWTECQIVDPQLKGEHFPLYLCNGAYMRFESGRLYPREWLRLALRLGPHHRYVSEDYYCPFGETEQLHENSSVTMAPRLAFPSPVEIARSPSLAVRVGVVWDGEDYFKKYLTTSLEELLKRQDQTLIYGALRRLSDRQRQVTEMQDYLHIFVENFVESPEPEWIRSRWCSYGSLCLGTLIDLSVGRLEWLEIRQHAEAALEKLAVDRLRWETPAWIHLITAAPRNQKTELLDVFLKRIPHDELDTVVDMFENNRSRWRQ